MKSMNLINRIPLKENRDTKGFKEDKVFQRVRRTKSRAAEDR